MRDPPEPQTRTVGDPHHQLLQPRRLWEREEVLGRPSPVPPEPGVYAWYFRERPCDAIDLTDCHSAQGLHLLYVGISPKRPALSGKASRQNLRKRIRQHYRGNASGSTLRLTLGCLLSRRLDIELRRVGDSERRHFGSGEAKLSEWMGVNALVCWLPTREPWDVESALIEERDLPLNLDENQRNAFHPELTAARYECRKRASKLPVVSSVVTRPQPAASVGTDD